MSYWLHYVIVLFLLTWGVIVRRREGVVRRQVLGIISAGGWVFAFFGIFVARPASDELFYYLLLKASSITTGCVYIEIVLSPRREPIPEARDVSNDRPAPRS